MGNEKAFGKLVRFGGGGQFALIDLGEEKPRWCDMEPAVMNFVNKEPRPIADGTEVDIEYFWRNKKRVLVSIIAHGAPAPAAQSSQAVPQTQAKTESAAPVQQEAPKSQYQGGRSYQKSPEEQETMKRENANHAVSRTLIALQGQLDPNSVEMFIKKFFLVYYRNLNAPISEIEKEVNGG
jgi:hypothetical protein